MPAQFAIRPEPRVNLYYAFGLLWLLWALSWGAAALWASRPARRMSLRQELPYRVLTALGVLLIFVPVGQGRPGLLWLTPLWLGGLLLVIAIAGMAFTWWARLHLGTLWSGTITAKESHRIVDSGPYAIVRHPIYTGLLLALYATALHHGTIFALAGAVVATAAFVIKARLEEGFLRQELGPAAYDAYSARVPMLVPFWPIR